MKIKCLAQEYNIRLPDLESHTLTISSPQIQFKMTNFFSLVFLVGTIFLERWKRANARLSYQWDVDTFEEQVQFE